MTRRVTRGFIRCFTGGLTGRRATLRGCLGLALLCVLLAPHASAAAAPAVAAAPAAAVAPSAAVAPAVAPFAAEDALQSAAALGEAVAAYRTRDYVAAMNGFAALATAEPDPNRRAVLHANAGTAAARAGAQWRGDAVWHLMMARRLDPGDTTARLNLSRVRALADTGGSEARQLSGALAALPLEATPAQTLRGTAMLVGLGLVLAALWRVRARGSAPFGQRVLGWVALLLVLLPPLGMLWSTRVRADAARQAVVLGDVVPLRAEPQGDGTILFRLAAGTVVLADDQRPGWRLVETDQGARGWVAEGRLRLVDPWAQPIAELADG